MTESRSARRNAVVVLLAMAGTFVVLRAVLHIAPDSDFNVAGYNIHHLFTGLVLITAGGVPLALFVQDTRWLRVARVTFGAGLGMALDEWVYLIATDGSNASYLLPVSFWGGVIVVGLACTYVALLGLVRWRRRVSAQDPGRASAAHRSRFAE